MNAKVWEIRSVAEAGIRHLIIHHFMVLIPCAVILSSCVRDAPQDPLPSSGKHAAAAMNGGNRGCDTSKSPPPSSGKHAAAAIKGANPQRQSGLTGETGNTGLAEKIVGALARVERFTTCSDFERMLGDVTRPFSFDRVESDDESGLGLGGTCKISLYSAGAPDVRLAIISTIVSIDGKLENVIEAVWVEVADRTGGRVKWSQFGKRMDYIYDYYDRSGDPREIGR